MGLDKRRFNLIALTCLALVGCRSAGWEWANEETATSNLVLSDTTAFFASTRFGVMHYLNATILDSGALAWKVRLRGWEPYTHVVSGDGVVVVAGPGFMRAFDAHSGRDRWRISLDARRVDRLRQGAGIISLVVAGAGGARELLLIRLASGDFVAARPLDPETRVWRSRGELYLGDREKLTALHAGTGVEFWSSTLPVRPDDVHFAGDTLVVVGADRLAGVAREDGIIRWVRETDGEVTFRARDAFGCYAQGGSVHAIDVHTGTIRWDQRVAGVVNPPLVSERSVWIHTAGGWLLALDRTRGRLLWKMNIGPPGAVAVASEHYYTWVRNDGVHVVDLGRREARRIIAIPSRAPDTRAGGGAGPALGMSGPWLWYVAQGGTRVVVRRLGS